MRPRKVNLEHCQVCGAGTGQNCVSMFGRQPDSICHLQSDTYLREEQELDERQGPCDPLDYTE